MVTCLLVASCMGQIEHEHISARPMLPRDDAIYDIREIQSVLR